MNSVHVTVCLLLMVIGTGAQVRAQKKLDDPTVSAADRSWIASKIYSSKEIYFAHWEAVPGLDHDHAYREYLQKTMATDDRFQFDLASMEFIAKLQNGHSDSEQNLQFYLRR